MTKRVRFSIQPSVADDLETLARLVGIRQYKGRLVNLLLERAMAPYQPAIARLRCDSSMSSVRLSVGEELEMVARPDA